MKEFNKFFSTEVKDTNVRIPENYKQIKLEIYDAQVFPVNDNSSNQDPFLTLSCIEKGTDKDWFDIDLFGKEYCNEFLKDMKINRVLEEDEVYQDKNKDNLYKNLQIVESYNTIQIESLEGKLVDGIVPISEEVERSECMIKYLIVE